MRNNLSAYSVFLCKALNWLPIIHVSCDERYGSYAPGSTVRNSALVLSIGLYKIYFLTYSNGRLSLYFILKFRSVAAYPSIQLVEQKADKYYLDMKNNSRTDKELEIQYEFLKEAYNNACTSKSSMLSKASYHVSTYLVLTGFYAYVFNELWKLEGWQKLSASFFIFGGVVFLVTAGVFIFSLLQISSEVRSTFKEVKVLAGSTCIGQAKSAYINWYASKEENNVLASQVKNTEMNMIIAFLIIAALWVFVFISGSNQEMEKSSWPAAGLEIQILNSDGILNENGLRNFFDILKNSNSRPSDQYMILSGRASNSEIYSSFVGLTKAVVGHDHVSELYLSSSSGIRGRLIIKIEKRDAK